MLKTDNYEQALLLAFIAFMFWLSLRLGALGGEQGTLSGIAGALERRGWMGPAQANGRAGELGTPPIKGQTAADIAAKLKEKYGAEVVHAKRCVTAWLPTLRRAYLLTFLFLRQVLKRAQISAGREPDHQGEAQKRQGPPARGQPGRNVLRARAQGAATVKKQ